jgi:hypothetical protein
MYKSSATPYTKNANGWNQLTRRSMHGIVPLLQQEKMELGVHDLALSFMATQSQQKTQSEFERNRSELVIVLTPAQVQV